MAAQITSITLLMVFIKLTMQADLEVTEVLNVDEKDLSQLLQLLKGKGVSSMRHKGHKDHYKQDGDMNMEALTLIMKRHGSDEDNGKKDISDRICKKLGRCGCSGGRCGDDNSNERDDSTNDRLTKFKQNLNRNNAEDLTRSISELDLKKQLERYGKKHKINEDLDAIVLDINDVMKPVKMQKRPLDTQDNLNRLILDLDGTVVRIMDKESDQVSHKKLEDILDYNEESKPEIPISISPEDFVQFYDMYKQDVTKKLINYLRNPLGDRRYISHLPNKQQNLLDTIKLKVLREDNMSDEKLEKLILQIIFGNLSRSKVKSHEENNDNIYIPKWLHRSMEELLNQKYLRVNNKIMPPTEPKIMKKGLRNAWRRNFGPNAEQLGVPFELNLRGLGQAVP